MTKIMSISLGMFLFYSNQLMCSQNQKLRYSGNGSYKFITLHSDAEIKLCGNDHYLECNVLPSVKKIIIKTSGSNNNQAIIHMPFSGEMPEVICHHANSNDSHVTIYSFKDVKLNCTDSGNHNSCSVVSPLRKLFVPIVVGGVAGLIYWKFA